MKLKVTIIIAILSAIYVSSPVHSATNLPLPRFISLKSSEANVRAGPGLRYQIKWVLVRKGIPLEVISEFEQWRKVRDIQGDEGWVHRSMLTNKRSIIITGKTQTLKNSPSNKSYPIAHIEVGVNADVISCKKEFCRVKAGEYKGWISRKNLWGVYKSEIID